MTLLAHACLVLALGGEAETPSTTPSTTAIPRGTRRSFLDVHVGLGFTF